MAVDILKFLSILALVAGINLHFQEAQNHRTYRNMYQERYHYDSLISTYYDSLAYHYEYEKEIE